MYFCNVAFDGFFHSCSLSRILDSVIVSPKDIVIHNFQPADPTIGFVLGIDWCRVDNRRHLKIRHLLNRVSYASFPRLPGVDDMLDEISGYVPVSSFVIATLLSHRLLTIMLVRLAQSGRIKLPTVYMV